MFTKIWYSLKNNLFKSLLKSNRIINQHDAEGRPHGVWEDYRSDGTPWRRAHYHHGRRHGVWECYRPDGKLAGRVHYHHGVRKGLETGWDTQGGIKDKAYHLVIR
jgi:antitoxin component YwqK of YwqJK toxin-antitoxin module